MSKFFAQFNSSPKAKLLEEEINMPKFFTQFNPPPKVKTKLDTETTFISQSEVETSSLAYQMKRYGMDSLEARLEQMRDKFGYADCTRCNDFQTIQNTYRQSVEYFEALPSEVRRQYHDRPEEFYEEISKSPKLAVEHGYISPEQYEQLVGSMPVDSKSNTVDVVKTSEPLNTPQSASVTVTETE